jgi:hypothetical protein
VESDSSFGNFRLSARLALCGTAALFAIHGLSGSLPVWDVGNWTDQEQEALELINRARANPVAEGQRLASTTDAGVRTAIQFFGVNLPLMQSEFNLLAAAQPLAPSRALRLAARGHSEDMLARGFQGHTGSDGSVVIQRVGAAGYTFSRIGENVFAYAESVWHGHAGFGINWGSGSSDGMQVGRGHRNAVHNRNFREAGIGIVLTAPGGVVGPQVVTQNFAEPANGARFLTGVVYYDLNGNQFFDAGEGIPGVEVVSSRGSHLGLTNAAGGWALPIASSGSGTLGFYPSAALISEGMVPVTRALVLPLADNVKEDLRLAWSPPAPQVSFGELRFSRPWAVDAADAIVWRLEPTRALDAEQAGSTEVQFSGGSSYSWRQATVVAQGGWSYRLAHNTSARQSLTLEGEFLGGSAPEFLFLSRLGYATVGERAAVQISVEDGPFQDVWEQSGNGWLVESSFAERRIQLAGVAGKRFRLRLVYDVVSGSHFPPESSSSGSTLSGWFLDSLRFADVSRLAKVEERALGGSTRFSPQVASEGDYLVALRLRSGARQWPVGPGLRVRLPLGGSHFVSIEEQTSGDGWRSSWFGTYHVGRAPWFYHIEHGWIYLTPGGAMGEAWFVHDRELGWLWTAKARHPWFYSYQRGAWVWYWGKAGGRRQFWDASQRTWFSVP